MRQSDREMLPELDGQGARRSGALLTLEVFVWAIVLLPARLVVTPIGSFGSPASLVGLFAFLLWAAGALRQGLLVRVVWPVRATVLGLALPSLISYFFLHLHATPGDEVNSADRWLLSLLVWSGVALLAAEGLAGRREVERLLRVAVAGAATVASIAVLQSRLGIDPSEWAVGLPGLSVAGELQSVLSRSGFARPAGTATHPLELGAVLAMLLGPALALAFFDDGWRKARRWGALAFITLGIPIALSRSAMITSVIVLVFWFASSDRTVRLRTAAGIASAGVVLFLTTPGLLGTLRALFAGASSDSSITTRTDDYAAVAHFIRRSPVIGRGPATFLPRFRILDNQWLVSLIETGVVGVLGFAVYTLGIAFIGRGIWHREVSDLGRAIGHSLAGVGFVAAAAASTYDLMAFPMLPGLFAVLLGIAGAAGSLALEQPVEAPVNGPEGRR